MVEGKSPPNTIMAGQDENPGEGRPLRGPFPGSLPPGATGSRARRNGATTRSPTMSPSHQVSQIAPNSFHCANPLKVRVSTPQVAHTAVLKSAA